jgi:hypothetical protein
MHAGMMARGEGALPKSIAHFQIWLSVFVDLHRAKDHEKKSISVLRVDPHAHRGMRYGHTNNPVHLPNSYVTLGLDPRSQKDFVPMSKRAVGE